MMVVSLSAAVGAEPQWLYVRLAPQAVPLVQSRTLDLGGDAIVERLLLEPEQTLSWRHRMGKTPSLRSWQVAAIERAEEPLARTICVRYTGPLPAEKFCVLLMATHPLVEYAEPVRRQRLLLVPNDPLFSDQTYLQAIEAPAAWDITTGSPSVLIGVSDSGVRFSHEDLGGAIAVNSGEIPNNGIDDDGNGYVDDYRGYNITWRNDGTAPDNVFHPTDGHGTSVAGIIAAVQNNGKGISGVAPGCRIVPIKATPNSTDGYILFGYESLIYAALRGCKVVNCSWGNEDQAPSPIEESIIAFALAHDVAIVAASGNGTGTQPMYPAAYPGVLGVGETETDGRIVPGTGIGAHCRILAPGSNARTTGNVSDADYTYFSGTSSATPMVSGVLALVRSRFPQLDALQAIEHVRLSARDVSNVNPDVAILLPGMVNARSALERDPFSTPAIVPMSVTYQRLDGTPLERTQLGDTVLVYFRMVNRLGSGTQLRWTLQVIQSWGGASDAVVVLDSQRERPSVAAQEEFMLGPFSMVITQQAPTLHFLRLEVSGRGSSGAAYHDVALVPFYPTPDWATIRRDSLALSLGDYGWIGRNTGSGEELKGEGLAVPSLGSLLYGGGVYVVSFSTEQVWSGIEGDGLRTDNAFIPVERPSEGTQTRRILRLAPAGSPPPCEIELAEKVEILDRQTVHFQVTLSNVGSAACSDVAVGHYFDFDLTPTGDSSAVSLLFDRGSACAEMMERMPGDPIVVAVVRSGESDAQLQCAGLDAAYASVSNFLPERKMETLRRGTSLQMGGLGDKSVAVGARFAGPIVPASSRSYEVFLLFGRNRTELRQRAEALASAAEQQYPSGMDVWPDPLWGNHAVFVSPSALVGQPSQWHIISLDGRTLWQAAWSTTPARIVADVAELPSGAFALVAESRTHHWQRLIVRMR